MRDQYAARIGKRAYVCECVVAAWNLFIAHATAFAANRMSAVYTTREAAEKKKYKTSWSLAIVVLGEGCVCVCRRPLVLSY